MKRFALWMAVFGAMAIIGAVWAGDDKEQPKVRLEIDLVDGSHVIGIANTKSIPLQSSYAKMDVALKEIRTIKFDTNHETASIDMLSGDKLKGVITLTPIKLETEFGAVAVDVEHIRELRVVVGGAVTVKHSSTTKLEAEVKKEPTVRLEMDLVDGSHVIGTPSIKSVPVQTSYAKMDIPLKEIRTIKIDTDHETASLDLMKGDKVKGVISLESIKLETVFGAVSVAVEHIKNIDVGMSGAPLSTELRKGLVLYYSFDQDDGGKVVDKSGNNHDGEVCGAIWTAKGKVGGAYQVGKQVGPIQRSRVEAPPKWGTAPPKWGGAYQVGHIQAPDNEAWSFGTKPFSICLWFKFNAPPVGEQDFIGHNEGLGERSKWAFQMQNGNLDFHINNPSRENYRIAAYPWSPQTDRYYHLSVTRNGDTYSIYVDGTRVSTDTNTLPVPVAKALLTIGQAEGLYVEGTIDEVMIFSRALSGDEVKQLYDANK